MSVDVPLGLNFNMVQVFVFLAIMAQITGLRAGKAYHKLVNVHIYEDQIPAVLEMLSREPKETPAFIMDPRITSLEDLETWVTTDNFRVIGYESHPPIKIPFSV